MPAASRRAVRRRRREPGLARDHQRFRGQRADATERLTGSRNRDALERRIVLDVVRRLAVRHLPGDLAFIEIDRGDAAVRRLDDRQTLHGQPGRSAFAAAAASAAAAAPGGGAFGSRASPEM